MVCDSVEQLINKDKKKLYARHWMLIDELMEIIGMPFFYEPTYSNLVNLQIVVVEDQREQISSTIQNLSQVDVSSFRLFTTAPAQL